MNTTPIKHAREGFTLIELLTVIAIIGILAGILIPVVGGAKTAAKKAQTRAQFSGWAQALEQYKKEYGFYPNGPGLNLNSGSAVRIGGDDAEPFILALSARDPASGAPDRSLNRKGIGFYSFGQAEQIDAVGDVNNKGLYDAFGNPEIFVAVDHDGNGLISASVLPDESEDLKARVAIWSVPGSNPDFHEVKSWN